MKKTAMLAAVAGVVTLSALAGAAPAGAGKGGSATLTVTKTVDGTAPADAEFVINVLCVEPGREVAPAAAPAGLGAVYDEDVVFGPEGGSEDFVFFEEAVCTITELDDGGADEVIGGEQEVRIEEPVLYEAEVINVFEPAPTTVTTAKTTTTTAAAAAVTRATPRFTG